MTTVTTFLGKEDGKNSSRVLQPPGGGSSNIFGPAQSDSASPQKHNHTKSNVFGADNPNAQSPAKQSPANQPPTKDRVFGETKATPPPPAPAQKHQTGDRLFGDTEAKQPPPQRSQAAERFDPITGQKISNTKVNKEKENQSEKGGFNPITHEAQQGDGKGANLHTSTRVKQPPGGASTPLW